jgi:hypothetical protein
LTGMSATALVYFGQDENALQHKIIVVAEAAALAQRANGDENPGLILLRSLLSEGRVDRLVTIPQREGPPQSLQITRNGPVVLIFTSARDNVESEMLTRVLICDADESAKQSERVLERKLNQGEKLEPVAEEEIERWQALQRWLALDLPYCVAIPFEQALHKAYGELIEQRREILRQLRIRRDINGLLIPIKASAVLHKAQRQTDVQGRIVATLDDYQHAWFAFNTGMASLYGVRNRETVTAVVEAAERLGVPRDDGAINSVKLTVAAVRKALGITSNRMANERIEEAIEQDALKEDDAKRGTGKGSPRYFWITKTVAELSKAAQGVVFPLPHDVKKFLEGGPCPGHRDKRDKKDRKALKRRSIRFPVPPVPLVPVSPTIIPLLKSFFITAMNCPMMRRKPRAQPLQFRKIPRKAASRLLRRAPLRR